MLDRGIIPFNILNVGKYSVDKMELFKAKNTGIALAKTSIFNDGNFHFSKKIAGNLIIKWYKTHLKP